MQIKYRITIVFTVIVTVMMLLFSVVIYIFSYQEMENRFKVRLRNKATSTIEFARSTQQTPALFKKLNQSTAESFFKSSTYLYDYNKSKSYSYHDKNAKPLSINNKILNGISKGKPYFFSIGDRDAIAIEYKDAKDNYVAVFAAKDQNRIAWLNKLKWILIISLATGFVIIVTAGYIFSISLISALSEFTQKIKHISSEKFSLRLATGKTKDEFHKLAVTINDLLDRLQASFNLQRRFIDNASHELSTPLASISSQMDVALQRERTSEEYKKALLSMNDDVRRLSLLLRSLLEIAKVSGSMGGTELTSVRIDELLMRIPPEVKKISPMYDVNIEFKEMPEDESSFIIYGNEHLLYSAIKNIVHNACKFSEDKRAELSLSFTKEHITIIIHDNGPGIDDKDLRNIFQPFYRSNRHESYISGSGLGLSLAHRIIGLHKGSIEVNSAVGEGTTFTISLPLENSIDKTSTS